MCLHAESAQEPLSADGTRGKNMKGRELNSFAALHFLSSFFFLKSHPSIYLAYLLSVLMKDIVPSKPPSPSHSTIIFICQGGAAE